MDELKTLLIDQAKAHPLAVSLAFLAVAGVLLVLAAFGAVSGHLDPDAMPTPRTAALVRIGRRIGVVFQGSRADFVQLWSGEWQAPRPSAPVDDRPTDPPGSEPPTPRTPLDAPPTLPAPPSGPRAG